MRAAALPLPILCLLLACLLGCGRGEAPAPEAASELVEKGAIECDHPFEVEDFAAEDDLEEPHTYDSPVEEVLGYLASKQRHDGGWDKRDLPAGAPSDDPALTALVLQALLHAGYTNRGKHPFSTVISRGIRHLRKRQTAHGRFETLDAGNTWLMQLLVTRALVDIYEMTGSPIFKRNAVPAVRYLQDGLRNEAIDGTLEDALVVAILLTCRQVDARQRKHGRKTVFDFDESLVKDPLNRRDPGPEPKGLERARWGLRVLAFARAEDFPSEHTAFEVRTKAVAFGWPEDTRGPTDPRAAALEAYVLLARGRRETYPWRMAAYDVLLKASRRNDAPKGKGLRWWPARDPEPLIGLGEVARTAWLADAMVLHETGRFVHGGRVVGPRAR